MKNALEAGPAPLESRDGTFFGCPANPVSLYRTWLGFSRNGASGAVKARTLCSLSAQGPVLAVLPASPGLQARPAPRIPSRRPLPIPSSPCWRAGRPGCGLPAPSAPLLREGALSSVYSCPSPAAGLNRVLGRRSAPSSGSNCGPGGQQPSSRGRGPTRARWSGGRGRGLRRAPRAAEGAESCGGRAEAAGARPCRRRDAAAELRTAGLRRPRTEHARCRRGVPGAQPATDGASGPPDLAPDPMSALMRPEADRSRRYLSDVSTELRAGP